MSALFSTRVFVIGAVLTFGVACNSFKATPASLTEGSTKSDGLSVVVQLNGSVTDDGLPSGATLSKRWSLVSGPAPVTFSDATNPRSTVEITRPGQYVLRLTGNDTALSGQDEVTITAQ